MLRSITGKASNLTVLDLDVRDGKDGLTKPKQLLCSASLRTGSGGWHLYFQYDADVKTGAGKLAPGIDTRSEGGYVVAPPPVHKNGAAYQWEIAPELAPPVPWPHALRLKVPPRGRPRTREPRSFDADNPRDVARLKHALSFIDASNYDRWTYAGFALGPLSNTATRA